MSVQIQRRLEMFRPPGPIAARYMVDTSMVRGIMGPVGSGKTSACLIDMLFKAQSMARSPGDGWRRFKGVVIRDTYRNLEKTTIPSWHHWMPAKGQNKRGEWTGGEGGRPAKHTIRFNAPDGGPVEFILEFVGLNDNSVESVLGKGYECTAAYLNEADLLDKDIIKWLLAGRIGRYPPVDPDGRGGCSWYGISLDFNAPSTQSWVYQDIITNPMPNSRFFRQPGGMDPGAENLTALPGGRRYYENICETLRDTPWLVDRQVHCKFGFPRDGRPIYANYSDNRHVAPQPLVPIPGYELVLGIDAGGTPACAVMQKVNGVWRILDEIVTDVGQSIVGAKRFGQLINALLAEERYVTALEKFRAKGWDGAYIKPIIGWGDPSSMYGADTEAGERTWLQILAQTTEIPIKPTHTNELKTRIEAVDQALLRKVDGDTEAFILSPTCVTLREGFNSMYRYRKLQVSGADRYEAVPEKNKWSHVHDGLQYGILGGGEFMEITGRRERRDRLRAERMAAPADEYNPYNH